MSLDAETIVASLLRRRVQLASLAVAVVRRSHDADDLFQQVVIAAIEHQSDFHDEDHLIAWSTRAIRHRAVDLAKKKKLQILSDRVLEMLALDFHDPAAVDGPCSERLDALQSCLEKLTVRSRTIMTLRYRDGLSVPEIARRIGRNDDAVYQILSRTQRALRTCVEIELHGMPHEAPATSKREVRT